MINLKRNTRKLVVRAGVIGGLLGTAISAAIMSHGVAHVLLLFTVDIATIVYGVGGAILGMFAAVETLCRQEGDLPDEYITLREHRGAFWTLVIVTLPVFIIVYGVLIAAIDLPDRYYEWRSARKSARHWSAGQKSL